MVAAEGFEADDALALFVVSRARKSVQSSPPPQAIRGKPDGVLYAADPEVLFEVKQQKTLRAFIARANLAVSFGDDFFILDTIEPKAPKLSQEIRELDLRTVDQVLLGNAIQGRLHGAGGNLEWLEKKS